MHKRETAIEHQTNITITRRSLEIDIAHQDEALKSAEERVQRLQAELVPLRRSPAAQGPGRRRSRRQNRPRRGYYALERHRLQIRNLSERTSSPEDQTELAVALARTRAALEAATAGQPELAARQKEAAANLAAARAQAKRWGITGQPAQRRLRSVQDELADLRDRLLRAEPCKKPTPPPSGPGRRVRRGKYPYQDMTSQIQTSRPLKRICRKLCRNSMNSSAAVSRRTSPPWPSNSAITSYACLVAARLA